MPSDEPALDVAERDDAQLRVVVLTVAPAGIVAPACPQGPVRLPEGRPLAVHEPDLIPAETDERHCMRPTLDASMR
jgi:hypothetical protein